MVKKLTCTPIVWSNLISYELNKEKGIFLVSADRGDKPIRSLIYDVDDGFKHNNKASYKNPEAIGKCKNHKAAIIKNKLSWIIITQSTR